MRVLLYILLPVLIGLSIPFLWWRKKTAKGSERAKTRAFVEKLCRWVEETAGRGEWQPSSVSDVYRHYPPGTPATYSMDSDCSITGGTWPVGGRWQFYEPTPIYKGNFLSPEKFNRSQRERIQRALLTSQFTTSIQSISSALDQMVEPEEVEVSEKDRKRALKATQNLLRELQEES